MLELSKDDPYDLYDSHGELLSGTTEDVDTGNWSQTNFLVINKQSI